MYVEQSHMRGLLQPILIVVAVGMLACGLVASCRTLTGSPGDWQPRPHECPNCHGGNIVDSDLLWWTCKWCGKSHAPGVGVQDENRPAGK